MAMAAQSSVRLNWQEPRCPPPWRRAPKVKVAGRHCRLQCRHTVAPGDVIAELLLTSQVRRYAGIGPGERSPIDSDIQALDVLIARNRAIKGVPRTECLHYPRQT